MTTTRVSYNKCSLFVVGVDMNCPLCGARVRSGERHECSGPEVTIENRPKKSSRAKKPAVRTLR